MNTKSPAPFSGATTPVVPGISDSYPTVAHDKSKLARINRRLQRDPFCQYLRVQSTRSHNIRQNHGRFILVDTYHNALVDADNNLGLLAERIEEGYLASEVAV